MFCEADRQKIECTVDIILFLRRYSPFPASLNRYIAEITGHKLFEKRNEDLMIELTHYLYSILNSGLCMKLIKWPTTNRKQFFQDVQAFITHVSMDPTMKLLPKAKASSLCFPTTSGDYEYQLNFIFQTTQFVINNLLRQSRHDTPMHSHSNPHNDADEPAATAASLGQKGEAEAINELVINYHKHQALVLRNEKLKKLKGKAKDLLDRYVNLMNLPGDVKSKLSTKVGGRHQVIKEYAAPIIERNKKLAEIKDRMTKIQRKLEEVKNWRLDSESLKSLLLMANDSEAQKLAENNNIKLYVDGKLDLLGIFQLHQLVLNKRIGILDLATNSPMLEIMRSRKDQFGGVVESMVGVSRSLNEQIVDKESSVTQIRDRCIQLKSEMEDQRSLTLNYRPSFSVHDSLQFSESFGCLSPLVGPLESRNSIIENIKTNLEKRSSSSASCSSESPPVTVLKKRSSMFNASITSVPEEPLSSSSPITGGRRRSSASTSQFFIDDTVSIIEDMLPELQLESLQLSECSHADSNNTDGDEFEKEEAPCEGVVPMVLQADDVVGRYLEFKRRNNLL